MKPRPLAYLTPALAAAALGFAAPVARAQHILTQWEASALIQSGDISYGHSGFIPGILYFQPPITTTGMVRTMGDRLDNDGVAQGDWMAYGGWDRLGVTTSSEVTASLPADSFFSESRSYCTTSLRSELYVNKLVISGPTEFATISLNLLFDGAISLRTIGNDRARWSTMAEVSFNSSIFQAVETQGEFEGSWQQKQDPGNEFQSSTGLLGLGYQGGPVQITTGLWRVPTGKPLTLFLRLYAGIHTDLYARSSDEISAHVDASHSLSLPVGSPVFNLPAGYNASAPSYGIVDNFFTPVPEPGVSTLVGFGLLGYVLWCRARRGSA